MKMLLTQFLWLPLLLLVAPAHAAGQEAIKQARLLDSFEWKYSEDTGARLDNLAVTLQNNPGFDGYVICYGPEGDGSGTGNYMVRASTRYLVEMRGIEARRVHALYAGRNKDLRRTTAELWVVPQGEAATKFKRRKSKVPHFSGKFTEFEGWDGDVDGADGVPTGNVTLAAFADVLRQQAKDAAYIVAYNFRESTPGTWRRVAKRDADNLQARGVASDRIKIIYGGIKQIKDEANPQTAAIELWVKSADEEPPVEAAPPEETPRKAVQVGSYHDYMLKYPDEARRTFEGFADVLRENEQVNICLIIRPRTQSVEAELAPGEPPGIDAANLAEKWKAELIAKWKVDVNRIYIIQAVSDEVSEGTIEVWIVPPGVALPDPTSTEEGEV